MKKIIILLFLLPIILIHGQDKYFVYFKDKGISSQAFKTRSSAIPASIKLSDHAIERRIKKMGDDYIDYDDLPVKQDYINKIENLGFKIHKVLNWFNAVSVTSETTDISILSNLSFVEKVEKVGTIKYSYPDNSIDKIDSYKTGKISADEYSFDYGLSLAQDEFHDIPLAHEAGYNGKGVIVGFLDAGFRWSSYSVFDSINVLYEHDYVNDDDITGNENGDDYEQDHHGTSVLSIAAGFDEGNLIGPAYKASVMLCKTEDITTETHVEEDNFAAAVEDLENLGVDIITASLGYSDFDSGEDDYTFEDMDGETTIVTQAYNKAFEKGVITVNAMGNEGDSETIPKISAPADAFNVIAVGNVNINNVVHTTSGRGPTYDGRIKPEVVAMGTYPYRLEVSTGNYSKSGYGTSYSAPFVAGMIAQLLQAYPHLNNVQVRRIVIASGDNTDSPDNDRGYGLLSIKRMLNQPNLEINGSEITINKMFIGDSFAGAPVIYLQEGNTWKSYDMITSGNINSFVMRSVTSNNVKFYFEYESISNGSIREPEDGSYNLYVADIDTSGYYSGMVPDGYELLQNYPNPFNSGTTIEFYSTSQEYAEVVIYDILGRQVRKLFNRNAEEGTNSINWDMRDEGGVTVASGVYIYTLRIDGNILSKKMILVK